ncbi:hypothetical protein ACTXT7_000391 [Hymenolepis weldensis]
MSAATSSVSAQPVDTSNTLVGSISDSSGYDENLGQPRIPSWLLFQHPLEVLAFKEDILKPLRWSDSKQQSIKSLNGLPSSVRPQQTPSSGGGEEETSTSTAAAPDETTTASEEARVGSGTKGSVTQGGGETLTTGGGNSGAAEKRAAVGDTPASVPPPAKRAWRDQPHVGKYKLIRTLGSGNFAKVKLAQHITTKKEFLSDLVRSTGARIESA